MTRQPEMRARIAKVHIAKAQLAMEEDSYRALLRRVTGKDSSKDMTEAQLDAVLAEFKRLGFTGEKPKARARRPLSDKAYVRMIYGLWKDLKPFVSDGSVKALQSFVRRQTGVDAPEFLNPEDANDVIEGLKAWLGRERAKKAGEKKAGTKLRRRPAGLPPMEKTRKT